MLKLDVNKEKELRFAVEIAGAQSGQVIGHLRLNLDGIEYGFPANIKNESITVTLPPLKCFSNRELKEGENVEVKLDIISDGNYLVPWKDTFKLSNPLSIKAEMVQVENDEVSEKPFIKTELVSEDSVDSSYDEDILTEKIVKRLAKKISKNKSTLTSESKKEKIKEEKTKTKKINTKDILNIDESGVYSYMERAGTRNPTIQKIIYEQAEQAAGSSKPVDVLRQVVKILKK